MPEVRDVGTSILENKLHFKRAFFHMTFDSFELYQRYPDLTAPSVPWTFRHHRPLTPQSPSSRQRHLKDLFFRHKFDDFLMNLIFLSSKLKC